MNSFVLIHPLYIYKTTDSHSRNKYTRKAVHVTPVGVEADRIVLPAIQMKADRVRLITHPYYISKVCQSLQNYKHYPYLQQVFVVLYHIHVR